MASRDISLLHPLMIPLVHKWIGESSMDVLVYCTVREPYEQAMLYATGRSAGQIASGVTRLNALSLDHHAQLLARAIPKPGRRVTNALPGLSFHQPHWLEGKMGALALDFVPISGGKALWEDAGAIEELGVAAEKVGLTWSGRWENFSETVHLQYDRAGELKAIPLAQGAYR